MTTIVDDDSYVRSYYGVPADLNRRITFKGRDALIVGFAGARLLILIDGADEPVQVHPTWRVDYLDGRGVRDGVTL